MAIARKQQTLAANRLANSLLLARSVRPWRMSAPFADARGAKSMDGTTLWLFVSDNRA